MKAVCHTDATDPSQSLVKSIILYYPESLFYEPANHMGLQAREICMRFVHEGTEIKHANLTIQVSGLVINPLCPLIRWSPLVHMLWLGYVGDKMSLLPQRGGCSCFRF